MWPAVLVVVISYIVAEVALIYTGISAAQLACHRNTNGPGQVVAGVCAMLCAMGAVVCPLYWFGIIAWETLK